MRNIPLLIIIICFSISSSVISEAVEVKLTDITGYYSSTSTNSSCEFVLDITLIEVYAVWIYFSGSVNVGEEYCLFGDPPPTGPDPAPMEFIISMRDTVSGDLWWTSCISELESGVFEFTLLFEPFPLGEPTWEFILLGGGTVDFSAHAMISYPECWYEVYPNATIEEATLMIDGDFPIAVETYTWGSIKSLFK